MVTSTVFASTAFNATGTAGHEPLPNVVSSNRRPDHPATTDWIGPADALGALLATPAYVDTAMDFGRDSSDPQPTITAETAGRSANARVLARNRFIGFEARSTDPGSTRVRARGGSSGEPFGSRAEPAGPV